MRHDQDEQERLQACGSDIGECLGPGERLGLTKIEKNDRQESIAIAPSTAGLANRPEQPEGECREQQDVQVENRLRVEAEEGVARDENQLRDGQPVSLDILPEPGEINSLSAGHEGDEEPVLPARSTVAVNRHETECHHGQDEPRSEYEPAGRGLISPIPPAALLLDYRLVAVAWSSRWPFSYPSGAVSSAAVRGLIIPAGPGVSWALNPLNLVSIRAAECFRSYTRLGRLSQRHSPEELAETRWSSSGTAAGTSPRNDVIPSRGNVKLVDDCRLDSSSIKPRHRRTAAREATL